MKAGKLVKNSIIVLAVLLISLLPIKADAGERLLDVKNIEVLGATGSCSSGYIWIDMDGSKTINLGDECWMGIFIKDGNVGIGTTGPEAELHLQRSASSGGSASAQTLLLLEANDHQNSLEFLTDTGEIGTQSILFSDDTVGAGRVNYQHVNNMLSL